MYYYVRVALLCTTTMYYYLYYTSMDPQLSCDSRPFASVPQLSCDFRPFASVPQLFNKLSRKSDPHQNIIAQIIQFLPPRRAHTVLEATLFLQKFPETRNRNRYLFSGKISETRAQGNVCIPSLMMQASAPPQTRRRVGLRW